MSVPPVDMSVRESNSSGDNNQILKWNGYIVESSERLLSSTSNQEISASFSYFQEELNKDFARLQDKDLEQDVSLLTSQEEDFFGNEVENLEGENHIIISQQINTLVQGKIFQIEEEKVIVEKEDINVQSSIQEEDVKVQSNVESEDIKVQFNVESEDIKVQSNVESEDVNVQFNAKLSVHQSTLVDLFTQNLKIAAVNIKPNFLPQWIKAKFPAAPPELTENGYIATWKQIILDAVKEEAVYGQDGRPLTEREANELIDKFESTFRENYRNHLNSLAQSKEAAKQDVNSEPKHKEGVNQLATSARGEGVKDKKINATFYNQETPIHEKRLKKLLEILLSQAQSQKRKEALSEEKMKLHEWIIFKDIMNFELKQNLIKEHNLKGAILVEKMNQRIFSQQSIAVTA